MNSEIHIDTLTQAHAIAFGKIVDADDIRAQFAQLNRPAKKIIDSVARLNDTPEISMTMGIFRENELVGFLQYFRKMDPAKRGEFEETDDIGIQLDPVYSARIDAKQLAVSPFYANIAIGTAHRGKGYSRLAMNLLKKHLRTKGIGELFFIVEQDNFASEKLVKSIGATLLSADFYYLYQLAIPANP